MNIASKITQLREQKGYSVNRLAVLSGLSQSFVRQLELGDKKPTVESLNMICSALNITLKEFFNDDAVDRSLIISDISAQLCKLTDYQLQLILEIINEIK